MAISSEEGNPEEYRQTGSAMKKIMMIIPTLTGGGAERVASLLSHEWSKNHDVTVVVFTLENQIFPVSGKLIDLNLGARKSILMRKIYRLFHRTVVLSKIISRTKPDLIVSLMESANIPAIIACSVKGEKGKLKVSVHGNPQEIRNPLTRLTLRLLYPLANSVVAPSVGVEKSLFDLGISKDSLSVIPNPAKVKLSIELPPHPLDNNKPYILGAGRLDPLKGFDDLIRSFALLPDPELTLVILGKGSELDRLQILTSDLGISNRVIFPGFINNLEPWFRHAECFCLTSKSESSSMVIVEALGYGCPVVSYDTDFGPREILLDGHVGALVAKGEIEALASKISVVINDDGLRADFISRGHKRYLDFQPEKVARLWLT